MHPIKEIKITIEYTDGINGKGSNDFKTLRDFMFFLRMKEKSHFADALGYDQATNKLKS